VSEPGTTRASILPMGEVPGDWVRDYLTRRGMPRHVVEWKYFDRPSSGGDSGYVWIGVERVRGFIGVIPFAVAGGGEQHSAQWFCDWSLERPEATPGMGIVLLKTAARRTPHLLSLGGNATSRNLLPRLANQTVYDAGISFTRYLRLGGIIRRVERRIPVGHLTRVPVLPLVPVRLPRRRPVGVVVATESGVSADIAPLLESSTGAGWFPRYDLGYVRWQIARCPQLVSGTCLARDGGAVQAAAVFWRPLDSTHTWRLALWTKPNSSDCLDAVLSETLNTVYRQRAMIASVLVSRLDVDVIAVLRAQGFRPDGRRPLHLFHSEPPAFYALQQLSYLDTDLAYRF
jgi:hypothetical protein